LPKGLPNTGGKKYPTEGNYCWICADADGSRTGYLPPTREDLVTANVGSNRGNIVAKVKLGRWRKIDAGIYNKRPKIYRNALGDIKLRCWCCQEAVRIHCVGNLPGGDLLLELHGVIVTRKELVKILRGMKATK